MWNLINWLVKRLLSPSSFYFLMRLIFSMSPAERRLRKPWLIFQVRKVFHKILSLEEEILLNYLKNRKSTGSPFGSFAQENKILPFITRNVNSWKVRFFTWVLSYLLPKSCQTKIKLMPLNDFNHQRMRKRWDLS